MTGDTQRVQPSFPARSVVNLGISAFQGVLRDHPATRDEVVVLGGHALTAAPNWRPGRSRATGDLTTFRRDRCSVVYPRLRVADLSDESLASDCGALPIADLAPVLRQKLTLRLQIHKCAKSLRQTARVEFRELNPP